MLFYQLFGCEKQCLYLELQERFCLDPCLDPDPLNCPEFSHLKNGALEVLTVAQQMYQHHHLRDEGYEFVGLNASITKINLVHMFDS